jgi:hypothetical protein
MRELAVADEADRQQIEADLLRDLGREPSATEKYTVEVIAAQLVRARRMRAARKQDAAEMCERLALRGLGKLGIRSTQKTADPGQALRDIFREINSEAGA